MSVNFLKESLFVGISIKGSHFHITDRKYCAAKTNREQTAAAAIRIYLFVTECVVTGLLRTSGGIVDFCWLSIVFSVH